MIRSTDIIHATGVFTEAYGSPTCWIYNQYHGSHGNINMVDAIRVSCNYYFYEVGFRLGGGRSTGYSSDRHWQHSRNMRLCLALTIHQVWNFQRVTRRSQTVRYSFGNWTGHPSVYGISDRQICKHDRKQRNCV